MVALSDVGFLKAFSQSFLKTTISLVETHDYVALWASNSDKNGNLYIVTR